MKKLVIIMLLSSSIYSQNISVSFGADIRNGLKGSTSTNNTPSLNFISEFTMADRKGFEVGLEYERFSKINFDRFGFSLGKEMKIREDLKIAPSISYSIINRWGSNWNRGSESSHLAFGANLGLRYDINDHLTLELKNQFLHRTDLNAMYGGNIVRYSGFLELKYKFKRYDNR